MAQIKVFGHRGAILSTNTPYQNSRTAFLEALESCDGFETDACPSRDGEVFLIHEAKYVHTEIGVEYCVAEHLTPESAAQLGTRRLNEMDAAEICTLRLRDGSPIPTLKETLALVKQYPTKVIDIELKGQAVLDFVLRDIAESALPPEQIILSSFNLPAMVEARRKAPHLKRGAIFVTKDTPTTPLFPWSPESAGAYTTFTADSLSLPILREIDPAFIIIPDMELNEEAVALICAHVPSAQLMAWVFTERGGTDPAVMLDLAHRLAPGGVFAGFMVDHPRHYAQPLYEVTR